MSEGLRAPLSGDDAQALARQVAQLAAGGLPLASGLRAAADEAPSRALAAALRDVAADLDRGRTLDDSLAAAAPRLPPHVAGLVRAGVRSGQLGRVLLEMSELQNQVQEAYRSIYAALAYPALLFAIVLAALAAEVWWLLPMMRTVFDDFDTQLPAATQAVFWLADVGVPFFLMTLAAIAVLALLLRLVLGGARSHWILSQTPLVGPLFHDAGTAEFSLLVGILLEEETPLPEALRLAADGLGDPSLAEACGRLAAEVEQGGLLSTAIIDSQRFPLSLAPIVEFGERTGTLALALRSAGEMFLARVRLRAALLATVLPPFAFIAVIASVCIVLAGILLPLMSVLTALSY